jgi:hypothetical protein
MMNPCNAFADVARPRVVMVTPPGQSPANSLYRAKRRMGRFPRHLSLWTLCCLMLRLGERLKNILHRPIKVEGVHLSAPDQPN